MLATAIENLTLIMEEMSRDTTILDLWPFTFLE